MPPRIIFLDKLPFRFVHFENSLLIYDKSLLNHFPEMSHWMRQFRATYGVSAGEGLKDLTYFAEHVRKIQQKLKGAVDRKTFVIVSLGGGSVGDFSAFFASVFKRGVGLYHIPTTYLSALDSAHGGKTALNVGGVKNQIGTFYPATKVFICKEVLRTQDKIRATEATSELFKIALLSGGNFAKKFFSSSVEGDQLIWKFIKRAIAAKYKITERDTHEMLGLREKLNLGHSMGHILEAHYLWPHGKAVAYGLDFALKWSAKRDLLPNNKAKVLLDYLQKKAHIDPLNDRNLGKLSKKVFLKLLREDKKIAYNKGVAKKVHIRFQFVRGLGRVQGVYVNLEDFCNEAIRQGWVRDT